MQSQENVRCNRCRYWLGYSNVDGECHRSPPTIVIRTKQDGPSLDNPPGYWPGTRGCDWCGGFGPEDAV